MSDFGEYTHHAGTKDHRCEWCGETIPKGEVFAHYKGQWQGEWQNWRMHEECHESASLSDDLQEGFMPFEGERPKREVTA